MEEQNEDDFVTNHIQQVRLAKKTGKQVDHVTFLQYLDDIAKDNVANRPSRGYANKKKKEKKRRKKKTHRGNVYKTSPRKKKRKNKKLKIGATAGDVTVWEDSWEAQAPTTAEKQEIIEELEVREKYFVFFGFLFFFIFIF